VLGTRETAAVPAVSELAAQAWDTATGTPGFPIQGGEGTMQRYLAEAVGTFVLVFGGCGSAVLAGDKIGFLGVSFAFGLSLLTNGVSF